MSAPKMNRAAAEMMLQDWNETDAARAERDEARAEARRLRRLVKQGEGVALNLKACRYGRECPGCVERANKLIAALARPTPKKRKSARRKP